MILAVPHALAGVPVVRALPHIPHTGTSRTKHAFNALRAARIRAPRWATARRNIRQSVKAGAATGLVVTREQFPALDPRRPVLVWFKHDLRAGDHPGLAAAAASACPVAAVFCLDPSRYSHLAYNPAGPEVLAWALQHLREALEEAGVQLLVRVGSWQEVIPAVAAELSAQAVLTEAEVEHSCREGSGALGLELQAGGVQLVHWGALVHDPGTFQENYRQWASSRSRLPEEYPAPKNLNAAPAPAAQHSDAAPLQAQQLRELLTVQALAKVSGKARILAEQLLAEAQTSRLHGAAMELLASGKRPSELLDIYLSSTLGASPSTAPAAGNNVAQDIAERISVLEVAAAEGQSFPGIFSLQVALGALSRRQISNRALAASGRQWWEGAQSLTRRAAAMSSERGDFHWQLAHLDRREGSIPGADLRWWRWRGHLTDYWAAEPPASSPQPDDRPAILLVHGFGAFSDQWRGNLAALAEAGYRVFAPTLPGFGRSEKAALAYSQELWGDFLRDFIVQVVGGPVVLAGNSIGGFISASMAADFPDLVAGLVLLNSAGPIKPDFDLAAFQGQTKAPPPKWVAEAVAGGLFFYLERTIAPTLKWLYPSNPDRADEWLAEEIYRAACDAGSIGVFKSVFYLPPPRPLNHLITDKFRGPTLVLQGAADPLNDARGRASQLDALCPNVEVQLLDSAGHCPHDEVPEQVNQGLLRFVRSLDGAGGAGAQAATVAEVAAVGL